MSRQTSNQTRNPSNFAERQLDRSKYHYVRIQKDSKGYESPIEQYLDKPSPNDPNKPMYELHSEDRRLTGDSRMAMLRCSIEDHVSEMAANAALASSKTATVASDETFGPLTSE